MPAAIPNVVRDISKFIVDRDGTIPAPITLVSEPTTKRKKTENGENILCGPENENEQKSKK